MYDQCILALILYPLLSLHRYTFFVGSFRIWYIVDLMSQYLEDLIWFPPFYCNSIRWVCGTTFGYDLWLMYHAYHDTIEQFVWAYDQCIWGSNRFRPLFIAAAYIRFGGPHSGRGVWTVYRRCHRSTHGVYDQGRSQAGKSLQGDVIMSAMASQITGDSIVCWKFFFWCTSRKEELKAPRHWRWPVDSPHNGPITRKMFPFDDIII